MTQSKLLSQFLRFLMAGALVLLSDALIFAFIVHVLVPNAYIANFVSRALCIPISFLLQRAAFTAQTGMKRRQLPRFAALWLFSTLAGALVLQQMLTQFGPTQASLIKLVVEAFLAILSFFAMRYWVYRAEQS